MSSGSATDLNEALDPALQDRIPEHLLHFAETVGATAAVVTLLTAAGEALIPHWHLGYPEEAIESWPRIPLTLATPLTEAVRTGTLVEVTSAAEVNCRYPALSQQLTTGRKVLAATPLNSPDGHRIGAIGMTFARLPDLISARPRIPTAADRLGVLLAAVQVRATPITTDPLAPPPGSGSAAAACLTLATELLVATSPAAVLEVIAEHGGATVAAESVRVLPLVPAGPATALLAAAGQVLRTGQPLLLPDRAACRQAFPGPDDIVLGAGSLALLPLTGDRGPTGALILTWPSEQKFDPTQVRILRNLARTCALALERAGRQVSTRARLAAADEEIGRLRAEIAGLRAAMDSRATIEQAKGMVMQCTGLAPEAAWEQLRSRSSLEHARVRDLATDIVTRRISANPTTERSDR